MTLYHLPKIITTSLVVLFCFFSGFILKFHYHKGDFINEVNHLLGSNIEMNGDISTHFLDFGLGITSLTLFHHSSDSTSNLDKIDIQFTLRSIISGKPQISKITLKNGEISLGNIEKFPLLQLRTVHFDNVLLSIPQYKINAQIKKGTYQHTDKTILFSGEIEQSAGKFYKISLRFNKEKEEFFIKIANKENKIEVLLSEEKKNISGSGKDLLDIISTFTGVAHTEKDGSHFSIDTHRKDKNSYVVRIDSDLLESSAIFFKDKEINNIEVDTKYLDLSRFDIDMNSLKNTLPVMLNIQRELFKDGELKFSCQKIKFKNDENIEIQLDFSDKNELSHLNNFSARFKSGTLSAKGTIERKWEKNPLLRAKINYNGTLPEGVTLMGLSRYYHDIGNLTRKTLNASCEVIMARNMFIISNAEILLDNIKASGSLQYNTLLHKIRGDMILSSLRFSELATDNILNNFRSLGEKNTSIHIKLEDIKLKDIEIPNVDFSYHAKNKVNVTNIDVDSDAIRFKGKAYFDQEGNNLEISIEGDELDAGLIKLPELFEIIEKKEKEFAIKWSKKVFPTLSSNFNGKFDVNFKRIFDVNHSESPLNFIFSSKIKEGVLQVKKFSIMEKDLLLEMVANITSNNTEKAIITSFSGKNLDLGKLFEKYFKISYVSGKANIQGDLSSKGSNIAELIGNLSGNLIFRSSRISLDGGDIDMLSTKLAKVTSMKELDNITRITFFEKSTPFFQIDGSANIANGILGTSLAFTTETTSGVLSSNFSLSEMKNASIARFFLNINDRPISVDINIEGTLWKPRIFFDNHATFMALKGKKSNPA